MVMTVMQVGIMRMIVRHRLVAMHMRVRLAAVPREIVFMLMMQVVGMMVVMGERLVRVPVRVPLRQAQRNAGRHHRR